MEEAKEAQKNIDNVEKVIDDPGLCKKIYNSVYQDNATAVEIEENDGKDFFLFGFSIVFEAYTYEVGLVIDIFFYVFKIIVNRSFSYYEDTQSVTKCGHRAVSDCRANHQGCICHSKEALTIPSSR